MFKKEDELISFDKILKDEMSRLAKESHRPQLIEQARSIIPTIMYRFLFVVVRDSLINYISTAKSLEEMNHYKSMLATLKTLEVKIQDIANGTF